MLPRWSLGCPRGANPENCDHDHDNHGNEDVEIEACHILSQGCPRVASPKDCDDHRCDIIDIM